MGRFPGRDPGQLEVRADPSGQKQKWPFIERPLLVFLLGAGGLTLQVTTDDTEAGERTAKEHRGRAAIRCGYTARAAEHGQV